MTKEERKKIDEWVKTYLDLCYEKKSAIQLAVKHVFKTDIEKHIKDYNNEVDYGF